MKDTFNIIHITASYKPAYLYGGPIQSVAKLCEALNDKRMAENEDQLAMSDEVDTFNLQVLTTTANGENELDVKTAQPILVDGVQVTYFSRWTKDHSHFSPSLLWELRKEILHSKNAKRQTPNAKFIIHIHAWWNLVSVLSCWVAKWYGVPVVLSPRGMLTAYTQNNRNSFAKKLLHNLIGKNLLRYCHIHATSEQEKQDILKMIKPKSITVIPNLVKDQVAGSKYQVAGSKYQEASSKYQETGAVFKLIFLSRIEEKKGLELLFDALSLLEIDFMLTIAGDGKEDYKETLKQRAADLKLAAHINWVGQVSNHDKFNLMAQHDLLVLTSYNENFANVVVESLSVGTPVLVSTQVGLADYVSAQHLGWVCELDATDIAEKLLNAFKDVAGRKKINEMAPARIANDFNDVALAKRYLAMYQDLA